MAPYALRRDEYFPQVVLDRVAVRVSGVVARVANANVCRVLCSGCPEQPQELQEHFTNAHVSRRRRFLVKFASVRARGCRASRIIGVLLAITANLSERMILHQPLLQFIFATNICRADILCRGFQQGFFVLGIKPGEFPKSLAGFEVDSNDS